MRAQSSYFLLLYSQHSPPDRRRRPVTRSVAALSLLKLVKACCRSRSPTVVARPSDPVPRHDSSAHHVSIVTSVSVPWRTWVTFIVPSLSLQFLVWWNFQIVGQPITVQHHGALLSLWAMQFVMLIHVTTLQLVELVVWHLFMTYEQ